MSSKLFTDFGLSAEMLKAIARLGFEQPAPIQAEALPPLLLGRDIVGQSQTGSGKTAAFAIPAIERMDVTDRSVQALILCPTRELAVQVSEEVHKLAHFKPGIRPLPIYGGQSYDRQFAGLRAGANIVIGTPGRVMDHMNRGTLKLDRIRIVILDEADEMLNMGFRDDIEFILKAVPPERQTVLFSATVPRGIEDLISRYTRDAVRVRIEAKALTVPTVEQVYVEVDRRRKMEALERLIDLHNHTRGIVFCNTQRMVDELSEHMNAAGYGADCIHGGMAQSARDRVMKKFRSGGVEFLVATDVAARGIDVDDIQVVFNYDLPYDGEDYVHRIGRTGRAGRSGRAVSFVSGREVFLIRQIERYTRQRMHRVEIPTHTEIEEAKLSQVVQRVREALKAGDFRHYDHLIEGLLEEGVDSMELANVLFHLVGTVAVEKQSERKMAIPAGSAAPVSTPAGAEAPVQLDAPESRPAVRRPEGPKRFERPTPPRSADRPTPAASAPPPRSTPYRERPTPPPDRSERRPFPAKPARLERPVSRTEDRPERTPREAIGGEKASPRAPRPGYPERRPLETRPPSRRTPEEMTRLWLSVGTEGGISPGDIKGCILGETGIAADRVGYIDLRERHSFVDVASSQVDAVLPKLNRAHLGGRKLKAKVA